MAEKENEPNLQYEEAPSGTISGKELIAYLGRNKIKIRERRSCKSPIGGIINPINII